MLEQALRTALDEVESAHAVIEQQKKDRDALRERIRWLSDRALFYGLASGSKEVPLRSSGCNLTSDLHSYRGVLIGTGASN